MPLVVEPTEEDELDEVGAPSDSPDLGAEELDEDEEFEPDFPDFSVRPSVLFFELRLEDGGCCILKTGA